MRSILVISPNYLHAVYNEIDKYSFHLQGYGSFKAACNGLIRINSSEIVGVAYLAEKLPDIDTEEHQYAEQFLNLYDLLGEKKIILFVCDDGIQSLSKTIQKLKNVEVFCAPIDGVVTDTVINKVMIGNLLLSISEPYKLKEESHQKLDSSSDFLLRYTPTIDSFVLDCLKPIDKLSDPQKTLENDAVYHMYVDAGNSLFSLIRKKKINDAFCIQDARLNNMIEGMLNNVQDDELWCIYRCIYEMEVVNDV